MKFLRTGLQLLRNGIISAHNNRSSIRRIHSETTATNVERLSAFPTTLEHIERLANSRKNHADLPLIRNILAELASSDGQQQQQQHSSAERARLEQLLNGQLRLLPNETHPAVKDMPDDEPRCIHYIGPATTTGEAAAADEEPNHHHNNDGPVASEFSELCRHLNILRTEHLGHFTGPKSYYLLGALADLEQALVRFTVDALREQRFRLVSVPDILPASVIQGCGMQTEGARNQVYKLNSAKNADQQQKSLCLSGTAEMALAGHYAGRRLSKSAGPHRVMATSRCYRAETSGLQEERGIYRVHAFTKVEMFGVCDAAESDGLLEEFRSVQERLFERLGLPCRVLDMPPAELGAPAYRKYDIEAWLPGRQMYGEISSCSNCTDYQARRLDVRWRSDGGGEDWVHTVNGTACAVPRMLIAIVENYQVISRITNL